MQDPRVAGHVEIRRQVPGEQVRGVLVVRLAPVVVELLLGRQLATALRCALDGALVAVVEAALPDGPLELAAPVEG